MNACMAMGMGGDGGNRWIYSEGERGDMEQMSRTISVAPREIRRTGGTRVGGFRHEAVWVLLCCR